MRRTCGHLVHRIPPRSQVQIGQNYASLAGEVGSSIICCTPVLRRSNGCARLKRLPGYAGEETVGVVILEMAEEHKAPARLLLFSITSANLHELILEASTDTGWLNRVSRQNSARYSCAPAAAILQPRLPQPAASLHVKVYMI